MSAHARRAGLGVAILATLLAGAATSPVRGQRTADVNWTSYGGDPGHQRYAPLDQIDASNFGSLEVAWRFNTSNFGPRPEFEFESTPLVVDGTMYSTAGTRRAVVAINARTGELKWMFSLDEGERGAAAPRQLSGRGLSYWSDAKEARIIYVTPGYRMVALDAATGRRVPGFGTDGIVDLKLEDDQAMDLVTGEIGLHSTPAIAKDVVIIGAAHLSGSDPKSRRNEKGYVRGYDVRTGKRLWIFHTIPRPGEFGNDTWERDSWAYTGNTGVWAQISVDAELGLAYLPVEMATGDYYGGHHPGSNLFAESLVAVDIRTGVRKWHYQLIHHGLWDWDLPCAPILIDITRNGRTVKAVAQPTKQSFLYVFNRETGEPIWPIVERPVEKGDVPGEWYSPTQPVPLDGAGKPFAYDIQGVAIDDLIDFTPELRAEAVKLVARFKIGPIFTPPVVSRADGALGTLIRPTNTGGTNWPGGSYDPETHTLYVASSSQLTTIGLVPPKPGQSDMDFIRGQAPLPQGESARLEVQGLPITRPPYGIIAAIDMDQGHVRWKIAHGETPDAVRNHPLLKGLNLPRTGRPGYAGTLVTRTLLIAGETSFGPTPGARRGALLHAYDKATGADAGAVYLEAPQEGSPMTYMLDGRQYLVVPISGAGHPGELVAFRAPAVQPR
ncbi:MAG TPA: PQQ-binding-like beta-propeller repeat protein [Vicinamibacterales bacterium]|nr:PQQ-binding-like beta-propeller repeat protein [Vicinamibacterales bacterium]